VQVIRVSVADGRVPPPKQLDALIAAVEERLRGGTGAVYFVSRLGHGRAPAVAACLLGRLYGLPCRDVLERVQSSHDARVSVTASGRVIPCPSTLEQVAAIERVLSPNDTVYGPTIHHQGVPTSPTVNTVALPKLRGRGPPVPLPAHPLEREPARDPKMPIVPEDAPVSASDCRVVSGRCSHAPVAAVLPDLRLTTSMEEDTKGRLGNARRLAPWAPAFP
jgi:hypothetical protein